MTGEITGLGPDPSAEAGYSLARRLMREIRVAYRRFWLLAASAVAPILMLTGWCISQLRSSGGDFSEAMSTLTLAAAAASALATCIAVVVHVRLASRVRVTHSWMKQALECQQLPLAARRKLEVLGRQGRTPTLIAAFSILIGVEHQDAPEFIRHYEKLASCFGLSGRADASL